MTSTDHHFSYIKWSSKNSEVFCLDLNKQRPLVNLEKKLNL
jgi:hypothetical protein